MSQLPYSFTPVDIGGRAGRLDHYLPVQLTPLVGRSQEVQTAAERLQRSDVRLLTLTGPPGIGKTRLAIQVATELIPSFGSGVYFVSLAHTANPDMVLPAIAHVLGVEVTKGQSLVERLIAHLGHKEVLLLLDNFEQVVKAAPLVVELLTRCPCLKLLVTSREMLRLSAEHIFPVPPLSLPPALIHRGAPGRFAAPTLQQLAEYEAIQLFVERATAMVPSFALGEENAYAIAAICRKLDGLPLAIELAAPRVRHLSPSALLGRLTDTLGLLTGGPGDLPLRHRTLRATIEWSYDLLDEVESQLFRRLAAFHGGATFEAIESVCNADRALEVCTLDAIASLLDKSLLQQRTEADHATCYTMLETIHDYAWEKLQESGEVDRIQRHHAEYFLSLAERSASEIYGPTQIVWLHRLEADHENLRAALVWSSAHDAGGHTGVRLAGALFRFWDLHSHLTEGRRWLREMLEASSNRVHENPDDPGVQIARISALNGLGVLSYKQGYIEEAEAPLQEAVAIARRAGDTLGLARSLNNLAMLVYNRGDLATAQAIYRESLELSRQTRDRWYMAASLVGLGLVASEQEADAEARSSYEESLKVARESQCPDRLADTLRYFGFFLLRIGDYIAAKPLFEESLQVCEQLGTRAGVSWALLGLGNTAYGLGNYAEAEPLLHRSLTLARELGAKVQTSWTLTCLGYMALHRGESRRAVELFQQGLTGGEQQFAILNNTSCLAGLAAVLVEADPATALVLLGAADAHLEALGAHMWHDTQLRHDRTLSIARRKLGGADFAEAYLAGRALTPAHAAQYALALRWPNNKDHPPEDRPARSLAEPVGEELTRRERNVAVLIAEGKSNRQIAEEITVSERTVEGHVSNILSKLGYRSRAQISTWVIKQGLADHHG